MIEAIDVGDNAEDGHNLLVLILLTAAGVFDVVVACLYLAGVYNVLIKAVDVAVGML